MTRSTQRHPTPRVILPEAFYSSELAETISLGFLLALASSVACLTGIIVFFASLLIEPSSNTQFVQYDRHVQADR